VSAFWLLVVATVAYAVGPQPLAAPADAITVTTATPNLESVIYNAPPGATFYFTAGRYDDFQFEPKTGQTYLAQPGAVLASATKSFAFECFDHPADNVTIQNFTIDGYLPPYQCGVIQSGVIEKHGQHWTVRDCEIRNCNSGGGAVLFDYSRIINCYIHHCDQIGFKMFGQSPQFLNNHVAYNNLAHKFAVNDEAGGSKFWNTTGLRCSGNEFDHNVGCGVWCDFNNSEGRIDHNNCHDNTYNGIYQEIGGAMTIEHNTCANNGAEFTMNGWLDGAGVAVEASHDVTVRDNTITDNTNGIGLIASERGDPAWQIKNVLVYDNTVSGTRKQTGVCWDGKGAAPWDGSTWRQNVYQLPAGASFLWQGKSLTLQRWQAAGNN
jgi:parallel beta-helix repeat protein